MKPILLKIKGINSFLEEQTIDFEKLCKNGLFGIFGPTGSGKSTIIDAMTIALYGKVARFEGDRSQQFINNLSDTGWVFFAFELAIDGQTIQYVAERSYKKDKDTQKIVKARLTKKDSIGETIICDRPRQIDEEIAALLGLSYKDFTRAVVLPQGKFSQFLLLANIERKDMLERIFDLEKYGDRITGAIKEENKKLKLKLEQIDTKLEVYGDTGQKDIEQMKMRFEELEKIKAKTTDEINNAQNESGAINMSIKDCEDLKAYKNQQDVVLSRKSIIENMRLKVMNAQNAAVVIPVYNEFLRTRNLFSENRKIFDEENPKLIQSKKELKISEERKRNAEKILKEQLPGLTRSRILLTQACETEKKAIALSRQRETLQNDYKIKKSEMDIKMDQLKVLENTGAVLDEKIKNIVSEIDTVSVSHDFRQYIEAGNNIVQKIEEAGAKTKSLAEEIKALKERIEENKSEWQDNMENLKESNKKIALYEKNIEILNHNKPLDNQELKAEVAAEHKEITYNLESFHKYKELEKELFEKTKKLERLKHNLKEAEAQAVEYKTQLKYAAEAIGMEKQKDMAAAIAYGLENDTPCPVCGSHHHPQLAVQPASGQLEALESQRNFILDKSAQADKIVAETVTFAEREDESVERIKKEIATYSQNVMNFNHEQELKTIEEKKAKIKLLEESAAKWQQEYEVKGQAYKLELDQLNQFTSKTELLKERMEGIEIMLTSKSGERIQLKEMTKENTIKLKRITDAILNTSDGKYKIENSSDFKTEHERVRTKDRRLEELNRKYKELKLAKQKNDDGLSILEKNINAIKTSIDEIIITGREKAVQIEDFQSQIKAVAENGKVEDRLIEVDNLIKQISDSQDTALKQYDIDFKITENFQKIIDGIEKEYSTLEGIYNKQLLELNKLVMANNFKDLDEFLSFAVTDEELKRTKNQILEYDTKLSVLQSNIDILLPKTINCNIEELYESLDKIKAALTSHKQQLETVNEELVLLKKDIAFSQENMEKIAQLKAEEKEVEKRESLVSELSKLFEGKKFVDFIAKKHLRHICIDASIRLKRMTNSRYALELDETDFIIRDDFAGGLRRSPKTLSGGETFMASLCLALALSGKVQLKSKASLEFFFLDEGFGSLDEEALNTVMDTLINLRSQNINVGVISHVEQMKSQMPQRLVVMPAVHGFIGSMVHME